MNEYLNEWKTKWTKSLDLLIEWMNEWMDECMYEWMNGWMTTWMKEWKNKWMNKWLLEWMNKRTNKRINSSSPLMVAAVASSSTADSSTHMTGKIILSGNFWKYVSQMAMLSTQALTCKRLAAPSTWVKGFFSDWSIHADLACPVIGKFSYCFLIG